MKLIVDSCTDIPFKNIEKMNAYPIALKVNVDGTEYLDQLEISSKEVSEAVSKGVRPLTSQVNPDRFAEVFREVLNEDNEIIYLGFSSGLSGTYQSSVIARDMVLEEFPDADITVIDSLSASYGYGLLAERVAKYINDGLSKEEVLKNIEQDKNTIRHLFTVNDLDYLAKGGRLSKGQAFLGSLLNIKPLLHVEDGKLVPIEKYRGMKRIYKRMTELMNEEGAEVEAVITHSDAMDLALDLKKQILKDTKVNDVRIFDIGPTILSHTGNGTVALFYFKRGE